jgi:hypothetical protein
VPCKAAGLRVVTRSVSPSMSTSFVRTFSEPIWSSEVTSESSTAFGTSFTGVTVTSTLPVSVPPWPSVTV